ncbi:MAG: PHP domain-containing protein [Chloroflexi bacterium]|nr:PHP domain-containing protein [Chloroflexota bacterium]
MADVPKRSLPGRAVERVLLIDLHTHTYPRSEDSSLSIEELLKYAKEAGLDGICVTEHDDFWLSEELARWTRESGILALPGSEVNTEEGHLLVFGLRRYVFGMHRASFVKALAEEAGAAVILAHPYRRTFWEHDADDQAAYGGMLAEALNKVRATTPGLVEVLNGRASQRQNAFSQEVASRSKLRGTGASDAHHPRDVGTFATHFPTPIRDLRELIIELKAGRCSPVALRSLDSSPGLTRQGEVVR